MADNPNTIMPPPWQWLRLNRRKYALSTSPDSDYREIDLSTGHMPFDPSVLPESAPRRGLKPFWKKKAEPDRSEPFSDYIQTGLLGTEGRWKALGRTESSYSPSGSQEPGLCSAAACDPPSARAVRRCDSLHAESQDVASTHRFLYGRPEGTRLCLASTSDWLTKRSVVDRVPDKGRDGKSKRPHVWDIFPDKNVHRSASRTSSKQGRGHKRLEPREARLETISAYVPRAVDDSAISAALNGRRMDDFNPDPSWNLALGSFASSPASSTETLPDQTPRSHLFLGSTSALESDVTASSPSLSSSSTRHQATPSDGFQAKSNIFMEFEYSLDDARLQPYPSSLDTMSDDTHDRQTKLGNGANLDAMFSSNGEVLY